MQLASALLTLCSLVYGPVEVATEVTCCRFELILLLDGPHEDQYCAFGLRSLMSSICLPVDQAGLLLIKTCGPSMVWWCTTHLQYFRLHDGFRVTVCDGLACTRLLLVCTALVSWRSHRVCDALTFRPIHGCNLCWRRSWYFGPCGIYLQCRLVTARLMRMRAH